MALRKLSPLALVAALGLAGCADRMPTVAAPGAATPSLAVLGDAEANGKYLVMFSGHQVPAGFADDVAALGGTVEWAHAESGLAAVAGLSADAAEQLAGMRQVQAVVDDLDMPFDEPEVADEDVAEADDAPANADNPAGAGFFQRQWHMRAIEADRAWAAGYLGSPEVSVAIIDTGIDYNHASLQGLVDLERSISLLPDEDRALEELFPGAHPIADLGRHGTHVASTVASTGAVVAGVTSKTTLFGVKVCRAIGSGCPRSATLAAIMYAADNGADIINMSLGGTFEKRADRGNWLPLIHRATNYAHRKGALVVVSAGNAALDMDHDRDGFKLYCNASNVVCVGGTGPKWRAGVDGPWDDLDQPYSSGNYGRSAVDVAAPSGNDNNFVYAACSSFSQSNPNCRQSNRYSVGLRGTSMAAPHAAGVAALIVAHEVGRGKPALVRNRLHQTADKLGDSANDPHFGKGRVNAARAVGL